MFLGTEEEAAEAYDIAAIKFRGLNAVTNFDMNRYDVKAILESNTLPIGGGAAKRLKEAQAIESSRKREEMLALSNSSYPYGATSSTASRYGAHHQASHAYPLLPYHHQDHQQQPLLTLQNNHGQDHSNISLSQYSQEAQFLRLYQQSSYSNPSSMYNNYLQTNPSLLHGFMSMGGSNSDGVIDTNNGGYLGGGVGLLGMGSASTTSNVVGSGDPEPHTMVKVDYDMPSSGGGGGSYEGWSTETVQGPNNGIFTMWND